MQIHKPSLEQEKQTKEPHRSTWLGCSKPQLSPCWSGRRREQEPRKANQAPFLLSVVSNCCRISGKFKTSRTTLDQQGYLASSSGKLSTLTAWMHQLQRSTDPKLWEWSAGISSRGTQASLPARNQPRCFLLGDTSTSRTNTSGDCWALSQRPSRFLMLLRVSPVFCSHFPSPSESLFSVCPPFSHQSNTDFASHSSTTFHLSSVPLVLFSTLLSFFPLFSYLQSPSSLSAFTCCRKQGAWNPCAAQTGKKPLASKHHVNIKKCHWIGMNDFICIRITQSHHYAARLKHQQQWLCTCYFSATNTVLPWIPNSQQHLLCKVQIHKMFPGSSLCCMGLSKHKIQFSECWAQFSTAWMHISPATAGGRGCAAHLPDTAQEIWKSVSFRRPAAHKQSIHTHHSRPSDPDLSIYLTGNTPTIHISLCIYSDCILKKSFTQFAQSSAFSQGFPVHLSLHRISCFVFNLAMKQPVQFDSLSDDTWPP